MNSIRHTLARRWWLIVSVPAITLGATLFVLPEPAAEYQATAILFVPSGAGQDGPGGANEAGRLAQQYTRLIPADERIMQSVADSTGIDLSTAKSNLELQAIPDSSLVEISFSGDTETEAVARRDALIVAVTEGVVDEPPTRNPPLIVGPADTDPLTEGTVDRNAIPPNFLQVISHDVTTTTGSSGSTALAVAALIGGIVIGVAGAIALERTDVRVDGIDLAVRRTGVPGSDLDDMPDQSVSVLLRHWTDLGSGDRVDTALLGVERDHHGTTTAAAHRLQRVQASTGGLRRQTTESGGATPPRHQDPQLAIRVGGAPGTIESGEWVATDCSVTVLVVPRGTRLRSVEEATSALRQLNLGPTWMLLTDRASRKSVSDFQPATDTPVHGAPVAP